MKISYQHYGAQLVFTLRGRNANETANVVNNFVNYGMILPEALPSQYDDKKHSRVVFAATKARVLPALEAIITAEMQQSGRSKRFKGTDGDRFKQIVAAMARARFAGFTQENLRTLADERTLKRDDVIDAEDNTPEFQRARELFRIAMGGHRESAKAMRRTNQE